MDAADLSVARKRTLCVALLVVTAAEIIPLAQRPGVPAFEQDWAWPADPSQIGPFLHSGSSPWGTDGIGRPAVYPTPWWPFVFAGMLCQIFGVHFGVVACLFAAVFAGSFGAALLAGALGCGFVGRFFAGLAFVANPVVLNEVHAGHWIYLLSYALLPFIALLTLHSRPSFGSWLTLGALTGIGGAQLQFLPMNLLIVAAFVFVSSRQHKVRDFVLIAIIALVVCAPLWAPGLLISGPSYLQVLKPLPHWELAQSAPIREALRLFGYIGGYDRALLSPLVRTLWWWLPTFASIGIYLHRKSPVAWALALVMVTGLTLVAGLHGPIAGLLRWLFAHVPSAAVFRELYHAAGLAAFSMAVLCALAIDSLVRTRRALGLSAGALALFACTAVALRITSNIPTFVADPDGAAAVTTVATAPGSGRYLALPGVYPVTPSATVLGGASPFLLAIGTHPTLDTPVPEFPVTYALAQLRENRPADAHAVLGTLATSFIIRMPAWRSSFGRVIEPNLRGIITPAPDHDLSSGPRVERLAGAERVVVMSFAIAPQALPGTYHDEARDLRAVTGGDPVDLIDPALSPNPRDAWARTALWPVLPAWALAQQPGVFTMQPAAQLIVPASLVVAAAADGPPRSGACAMRTRLGGNFAVLACAANPTLVGRPPLVVSSATRNGNVSAPSSTTGEGGVAVIESEADWELHLRITAAPGSAIVLRERFDPGWECSLPDARHVEVDGYANAWLVPRRLDAELVHIRYRGAAPFLALLWLSELAVAVAGAVAAAGLIVGRRRDTDVYRWADLP